MNTGVALAKPVRVIRELTPQDLLIRALQHAEQLRDTGHQRVDADYVLRVQDAVARHVPPAPDKQEE